jgi:putative flippase GtrA
MVSTMFHFASNRRYTFNSRHNLSLQLPKYVVTILLNYGSSMVLVVFLVDVLNVPPVAAVACTILTSVLITFIMLKKWVFKENDN